MHLRGGVVNDLELFHVEPVVLPPPEPVENLSADRRRTIRQKADVVRGVHPLMKTRVRPELGTCGGCVHRLLTYTNGNRKWPKCEIAGITHGAGSDCRSWWPACDRYEPGDAVSDDAARWTPEHAVR
jgi:hypothetical protein